MQPVVGAIILDLEIDLVDADDEPPAIERVRPSPTQRDAHCKLGGPVV